MKYHLLQRAICLAILVVLPTASARDLGEHGAVAIKFVTPDISSGPQQPTVEGQALLYRLLDAGELSDLHSPHFEAYQGQARKFYESTGGALPWIGRGKPTSQACAIIRSLKNSEYEGLVPYDYDGSQWDARLAQFAQSSAVSEPDLIKFDVALTISTMRYISDLHIGRVSPHLLHFDLDIDHTNFEVSDFIREELLKSQNVDASLEKVEPPFPVYVRTKNALRTYLDLTAKSGDVFLPVPSRTIKPGDPYKGTARLTSLLILFGDLPSGQEATSDVYRGDVVAAVKSFQQRHGLDANGLLDAPTLRELNTPLGQRVRQLEFTMERLRWLPHEFNRPPIVVNIPEFRLHADDEAYHWVLSMKVVVGKAYRHKTPVFASEIRSVIFRPYWNVPASILHEELLPHLDKDPSYFSENSYEIVDSSGRVVSDEPVSGEIERQLRSDELRVRQKPGPKNSLGLVKFDIPSSYDVYMHGTPATELFARSRRDFSHGCIRVEDPVKLAKWVLQGMPMWTEEKITAAMNGDKTIQVNLAFPIPVLILYSTAVVTEDGEVHFFDDIYGHDAALQRALIGIRP
jgi:L,D-transpeptidase YcbB